MRLNYRATGATSPRHRLSPAAVLVTAGGVLAGVVALAVVAVMLVSPPTPVGLRRAVVETADGSPTPTPTSSELTPSALPTATSPAALPIDSDPGSAVALLATLAIKGRAPKTGYDRSQFGQEWADTDRNGCDTRNDVLRRDLADVLLVAGTSGCVVLSGTLADPFSGRTMPFAKGTTSADIHVDHVVALSDAWQKGAQQWSASQRQEFGNDPLNLLAVDGALNMAKGDGDAATWLPPAKGYRCQYVARQVAVKAKYGAWVTQAEHDAIERVLSSCPDEPAPAAGAPVESVAVETTAAPPTGAEPLGAGCDPSYPDFCIPSLAAAGGDLDCGHVGGPFTVLGSDPHRFDGNGDGVGCEG